MAPELPSHQLPVSPCILNPIPLGFSLFVCFREQWQWVDLWGNYVWNLGKNMLQDLSRRWAAGLGQRGQTLNANKANDRRMLCWLPGCNLGIFYISNTAIP